ncbi:hypothetical protein EXIGLDRAFT_733133 [Exidia glandulosa HHB12029]|uniref:Uncharacterized protein n=1 Tax=Exidia glandulosa HHB12029 TaxID=1314781 RepID=A0A165KK18_EXIGL|nr:hypothetical protein EXIGLDRAFT_733133 [Exidia glandulosa HHB12029]
MAAKRTVLELDTAVGLSWYIDRSVLEGQPLARKMFKADIKEGQWRGRLVDEVDEADIVVVDAATGDLFGLNNADAYVVTYDYFAAVKRRQAMSKAGRPTLADFAVKRLVRDALKQGSKLYVDRTVGADAPETRETFLRMLTGDEWRARIVHDHFDADYNIVDPAIVDVAGLEKSRGLCLGCDYFTAAARLKDSGKPVQAALEITAFAIASRPVFDEQTYGPKPLDADIRETGHVEETPAPSRKRATSSDDENQEYGEAQDQPSRKRSRQATTTAVDGLPDVEVTSDGGDDGAVEEIINTQSDEEEADKLQDDEDEKQVGRTRESESPGLRTASERPETRRVPSPPSPLLLRKGFGNEEVLSWTGQLLRWVAETKTAATFVEAVESTSRHIALFDDRFHYDSFKNFVKYVQSGQKHSAAYRQLVTAYDRGANTGSVAGRALVQAEVSSMVRAEVSRYKAAYGHLCRHEDRPALRPCPGLKPRNASQSTQYTEEGKQWLEDAARYFIAGGGFPLPPTLGGLIYALASPGQGVTEGGITTLLYRARSTWLGEAYDNHIEGGMNAT